MKTPSLFQFPRRKACPGAIALIMAFHALPAFAWTPPSPDIPSPRSDTNSMIGHEQLVAKAKAGGIDLYFMGDSITRRWGCTDPQWAANLENWKKNFYGWNAADFGWGADCIQNILWRAQNGELDGVNPKVIVIMAGTNNVGSKPGDQKKIDGILAGIRALIATCHEKAPGAKIILLGITPRNNVASKHPDGTEPPLLAVIPEINQINEGIARMADGSSIFYFNINDKMAQPDGTLYPGMTVDSLHLTPKAYQIWADAMESKLTEILGPRASTDHAPPPTGDPKFSNPVKGS